MGKEDVGMKEKRKDVAFYESAVAELTRGNKRTKYRIREWKPIYTRIIVMLQKGMTVQQIAREAEIGYSVRQLMLIQRDPLFRMKLGQYNKKVDTAIVERAADEMSKFPEVVLAKDKLAQSSEKAADTLVKLMNPRSYLSKTYSIADKRLMVAVAMDILNRAGLRNSVVADDTGKGREYSPEEIRSALDNAKELEAITNRLDGRGSSYVLPKGASGVLEETVDTAPTDAVEVEGTTTETNAVEVTNEGEEEG